MKKQLSLLPSLWAIHPDMLGAIAGRLKADRLMEAVAFWWELDDDEEPAKPYTVKNGVARLDIKGPMVKEGGFWTWYFGGCSTEKLKGDLVKAIADEEVEKVLFVIDSPGGTLDGTPALAEAVRQARAVKPVDCHIDGCGCSAAYWVASQCGTITANPEADVANIGIYTTVTDISEMLLTEGIEVKLYATGKYKGAGVTGVKVTDAHDEQFKAMVSAPFSLFKDAVKTGRNLSSSRLSEVTEGFVYMAQNAITLGLVDRVGYMADGVPPQAITPDTTDDGTPPAPPSDEGEEHTHMNPMERFFAALAGLVGAGQQAQTPAETTAPPSDTAATATTDVNHGSQVNVADTLSAVSELQTSLQALRVTHAALQERLKNAEAENNRLMVESYISAGKVAPTEREAHIALRASNPALYDQTFAGKPASVAFGGGQSDAAPAGTVPATTALVDATATEEPSHKSAVDAHIEAMKKQAERPNALQKGRAH